MRNRSQTSSSAQLRDDSNSKAQYDTSCCIWVGCSDRENCITRGLLRESPEPSVITSSGAEQGACALHQRLPWSGRSAYPHRVYHRIIIHQSHELRFQRERANMSNAEDSSETHSTCDSTATSPSSTTIIPLSLCDANQKLPNMFFCPPPPERAVEREQKVVNFILPSKILNKRRIFSRSDQAVCGQAQGCHLGRFNDEMTGRRLSRRLQQR